MTTCGVIVMNHFVKLSDFRMHFRVAQARALTSKLLCESPRVKSDAYSVPEAATLF